MMAISKALIAATAFLSPVLMSTASAQAIASRETSTASVVIGADDRGPTIRPEIFGQFAEHLGEGVYGGIWVGRNSPIPNVRGIRSDVVAALRAIKVPVVRWPGGCFADLYNWRNGIGPVKSRVSTVNYWGNVVEPSTFGTDEYMDFIDQIGSEAYISVNVASRTPAEAAEWLEYMTTDQASTLGKQRVANGHRAPYKVKYLGIGNEAWGCGGAMTAERYVDEYKRFVSVIRNMNPAQNGPVAFIKSKDAMRLIAVGPDVDNPGYTDAVMKAWASKPAYGWDLNGLSLHFYTGGSKGVLSSPASDFGEQEYAVSLKNTLRIDDLIRQHSAMMDKYDPKKQVGLIIDEWGLWTAPDKGTNFMFMRQKGSLRDAILAALNLNIFARHADRVQMANIAQMVNVIHSLIQTDQGRMLLTPTYHVYKMYVPFQGATLLPLKLQTDRYGSGDGSLPQVDGIAARGKDGVVWLALTNTDANREVDVSAAVAGVSTVNAVGEVLTAPAVDSVNTFDKPATVATRPVRFAAVGGSLTLRLPPKSVTVVRLDR